MYSAVASSAVLIFLFRKFSIFKKMRGFFLFCPSLDFWISHMLKVVVYHTTIQKYINYKTKCKTDRLIVKGLTTGRQMTKCDVCPYRHIKRFN